jgi:hypothetical protein
LFEIEVVWIHDCSIRLFGTTACDFCRSVPENSGPL